MAYQHQGTLNSARALCEWEATGDYKEFHEPVGECTYMTLDLNSNNAEKHLRIHKGDWLVKMDNGFVVMTDNEFRRTYIPKEVLDSYTDAQSLHEAIQNIVSPKPCVEDVNDAELSKVTESIQYHQFPNTTQVVCLLTMVNGFYVLGEHSCLEHEQLDMEHLKARALCKAKAQARTMIAYAKRSGTPHLHTT